MSPSARRTAAQVIDTIPLLMRLLRTKFREKRIAKLSVAEFRTLAFVNANRGASLSEAAGHIGLSLPSMSKLVDGLVVDDLLSRSTHGEDRRRICLALTPRGEQQLDEAYLHTQSFFTKKFEGLTSDERVRVTDALRILRQLFLLEGKTPASEPNKHRASRPGAVAAKET
jgi:DNA-binding MarR family transcriptional regulator